MVERWKDRLSSRSGGADRPDPRNASPGSSAGDPRQRWLPLLWVGVALVLFFSLEGVLFNQPENITFSRFLDLVQSKQVEKVDVAQDSISGTYRSQGGKEQSFSTTMPPGYDTTQLIKTLNSQGAEVRASQPSALGSFFLYWILPFLIIGGIYYLLMRRIRNQFGGGAGGPLSFGRNKAKLYDRTDMKTTFNDVAGVDEVEAELVELVDYLKNPQKYAAIGAKIPKGVLLVGPPGTGKTLLARAVAGEAGVPFFYISASEFIELFVGLGAARVRDLFRQARERAPAIVFIDEIDSIGQSRAGATGPQVGSHQEQEQTLQQLLTEMDGFEPNSGVIIMAASNRPEVLDQALLRPGRFDRQIQVNLPDIRGRREILEIHARSVALDPDVDLEVLARRTPGFSGAQLANVINEGALLAARKGLKKVTMVELEEAIDRVVAGLERRSQVLSEDERRLVAYHEMGHALVAHFVEHSDPVHRISIIPRGIGALGYTQQLPDEERYLMSEPELRDRVAVLMGGRSAEEIVFGYATTGAGDDLKRATEIARRMVTEFGMSERVGPVNVVEHGARFLSPALQRAEALSEKTEEAIDREVRAILIESKGKAVEILKDHRGDLDALAELLLKKETLSRRDLEDYFGTSYEAAPEIPQVGLVGAAEDGGSRAAPERRASESSTDVGQPAVPVPGAERRDPPADSSSTLEMRRDERDEGSRGGSRGRPS